MVLASRRRQEQRKGIPLVPPAYSTNRDDSKKRPTCQTRRWQSGRWQLVVAGLGATALIYGLVAGWLVPASNRVAPAKELADGRGGPLEMPLPAAPDLSLARNGYVLLPATVLPATELGPLFWRGTAPVTMTIGPNQSFYEALTARGAAHQDIMAVVNDTKEFRDLRKVKSGEIFRVQITADGGLKMLGYDLDEESFLTWIREGDKYVRHDGRYPVQHRLQGVSGTIENSLYASLKSIGAPLSLAPKMNDILGWDIDFQRDLRTGDSFRILYDEVWRDGKRVRTGTIKAVTLTNRGHQQSAFLFTGGDQPRYYDTSGRNLQKQLLRAPLNYSRISDHFTQRRFHPVLKRWMPHLGVDYAAPLGTPVRAGGDGVIAAATRKKGNGRYIRIRHTNSEYETYYLHLSRFAKGIVPGKTVRQGQVIGYVGATGYATGPHLDYRVKRRGKFVNPRLLKLPAADPVPAPLKTDFDAVAQRYTAALNTLALNTTTTLDQDLFRAPTAPELTDLTRMSFPLIARATAAKQAASSVARWPATARR